MPRRLTTAALAVSLLALGSVSAIADEDHMSPLGDWSGLDQGHDALDDGAQARPVPRADVRSPALDLAQPAVDLGRQGHGRAGNFGFPQRGPLRWSRPWGPMRRPRPLRTPLISAIGAFSWG